MGLVHDEEDLDELGDYIPSMKMSPRVLSHNLTNMRKKSNSKRSNYHSYRDTEISQFSRVAKNSKSKLLVELGGKQKRIRPRSSVVFASGQPYKLHTAPHPSKNDVVKDSFRGTEDFM